MGVLLLNFLLAFFLYSPAKHLSLSITPQSCFAPCTLTAKVRVYPLPDDRSFTLSIDGEDYSTLKEKVVEERTEWFEFKSIQWGV